MGNEKIYIYKYILNKWIKSNEARRVGERGMLRETMVVIDLMGPMGGRRIA